MTAYEYVIGALVVILIGVAKAGFAGGVGAVATPLFCLAVPPKEAIGILLPVLCACDLVALYHYRKSFALRPLLISIPGAAIGITGAAFLLGTVEENHLKRIVGAIAVLFVLYRTVVFLSGRNAPAWKPGIPAGTALGTAAGFFSTMAHAAGPIMAAYLLPQNLGRRVYVGTTVVFFAVVNQLKLIPYGVLGLLKAPNLLFSLSLLPFVPLGVWLGVWLNRKMSERVFLIIVYVLLFLAGLKLLGVPLPTDFLAGSSG